MMQLRPYNQSQTGLAYRRKSWGLGGIDYSALDPIQYMVLGQMMTDAQTPTDQAIQEGAITTPANVQPGNISTVMWIAIGVIIALGLGVFDEPRRYGR